MDAPVYISQESGVVGLNFHQSKEVLITDSINGSSFGVRFEYLHSVESDAIMNCSFSVFVFCSSMVQHLHWRLV